MEIKSSIKQSVLFFLIVFLFYSCSMFETSQNASLSFVIDKNVAQKISFAAGTRSVTTSSARSLSVQEMEGLYFEISLNGSYEATKTVPVAENATINFENIPVGSTLYASAKAYRLEGGEKFAFYNGISQEITIEPGENSLALLLKKDEDALSSRFYVSQSGNDESGDGSYANPYKTIERAASGFSDTTKDYTIVVVGTLSGEQRIPKPSNVSGQSAEDFKTASSITLLGIDTSACLDGGFSSDNAGTTLTITSIDTVIVKCLKITGGYSTSESSAGGVVIGNGAYTSNVTFSRGALITGNTSTGKSSGGGVFLSENSKLTMKEDAEVSDCESTYAQSFAGGGIYSKGTLVMQDSSNIQKCKASYYGGAISLSGGTVTMNENSFIKGCTANCGGGVFVCSGGNFIMNGSSLISGCKASFVGGGAVYINDTSKNGTFTLNSGTVENNSAPNGGGVYIATWGNIIMSGGSIKNNTVSESGAGVYLESGGTKYLFTGGTIGGNTFEDNNNVHAGSGIYTASNAQNFFITLGGSFKVLPDNDINIGSSTSGISIASAFTNSSVATITLGSYTSDRQLLKLTDDSTTTLAAEYQKFTISPSSGSGQTKYWTLDSEGKLQEE